jgi:nucleoside 2-deoxyribosyltransferase
MKTIYLAGRIQDNLNAEVWRNLIIDRFGKDYNFLNPLRRPYNGNVEEIVIGDKMDIDKSDYIVAFIDDVPSWGTAMEILYGYICSKRIFVIKSYENLELNPWVEFHASQIFSSIEECFDFIGGM